LKKHADIGEKKNCTNGQSASAPRQKLERDRHRGGGIKGLQREAEIRDPGSEQNFTQEKLAKEMSTTQQNQIGSDRTGQKRISALDLVANSRTQRGNTSKNGEKLTA
jgi:hypothetical protein